MTADDRVDADGRTPPVRPPAPSVPAAQAALEAITAALATAEAPGSRAGAPAADASPAEQALAALLLLRLTRERLAGWESRLIEAARHAGASWTDLAAPLGVASRQAAERRYLRLRPGAPGTTGEQRVQATRDRRASDRRVAAWARDNAARLRQLAGQVSALDDLPDETRTLLGRALGNHDPAALLGPLAHARAQLDSGHAELRGRLDAVREHTAGLRQARGDADGP
ncbi:type III effector protein [Streptomyces sp. CC77]|uniref:type III effector protein n=1 Tax=Streptomyces sp. CC77 TaxID=1906739 RepID=UPI000A4B28F2|nr:type III effector protein [Streptomyces sp. CC77]